MKGCNRLMSFAMLLLYVVTGNGETVERVGQYCRYKRVVESVVLDCSRKNFTRIPYHLRRYSNNSITELDFSHNHIVQLRRSDFAEFRTLQVLRLSWNKLTVRGVKRKVFALLPNLEELYLDHNHLQRVPQKVFYGLRRLLKLDLEGNRITHVQNNAFKKLSSLKVLRLRYNSIASVAERAFKGLERSLRRINLKNNSLEAIPWKALRVLKGLQVIELSNNRIKEIPEPAFAGLSSLEDFRLMGQTLKRPHQRIKVHRNAFRGLKSLNILDLDIPDLDLDSFPILNGTDQLSKIYLRNLRNLVIPQGFCLEKSHLKILRIRSSIIANFPNLSSCTGLKKIDLIGNTIHNISRNAFSGLKVTHIDIFQKHNTVLNIDVDAFSNLPELQELDLSHYPLRVFPDFTNTTNLTKLNLQHCSINHLPERMCDSLSKLQYLDLSQNKITHLPRLSRCSNLKNVDLFKNLISSVESQFAFLRDLEMVRLSDNRISVIGNNAFFQSPHITRLYLDWNMIHTIKDSAFQDILNLEVLNISHNVYIKKLPSRGLKSLVVIDAANNPDMRTFPHADDLPFLRQLRLTYQYHCCFFKERVQANRRKVLNQQFYSNSSWVVDFTGYNADIWQRFNATNEPEIGLGKIEPLLRELNNNSTKLYFGPELTSRNHYIHKLMKGRFISVDSYCVPEPNDWYPCDDLMGREWLRCCVWVVVMLAVFGNVFVLIVLTANYAKLDVPRFLIINLAFADLCLGVYLAFLAFEDLLTLGEFRLFGLEWQFSARCRTAGFLAVFASELSVYTLSAMTIERFTTIKNSMHIEKRMSKRQAVFIMAGGWMFSVILAALPLYTSETPALKFSDYSKYSVCLPFEVESLTSKVYVSFILVFNMIAFLVILGCYIKIYLFISGSHAWNSGDARVARRMAILVFTDFLCWFPIVLIALSAVYDNSLVKDLWISKVLTIFVFPLNACSNPLLYSILTKQFRKDIMFFIRHVKGKSLQRHSKKSFFRSNSNQNHFKNSLTYSTSMRRGSSLSSFLFGRRCSSKADDIKLNSRIVPVQEVVSTPSKELVSTPSKEVDISLDEHPLEEEENNALLYNIDRGSSQKDYLSMDKDSGISMDKDSGISMDKDSGISMDKDSGISMDKDSRISMDKDPSDTEHYSDKDLDEHEQVSDDYCEEQGSDEPLLTKGSSPPEIEKEEFGGEGESDMLEGRRRTGTAGELSTSL